MMIDPVGQQLGNYRLVRLLGRGGFADVYLGEHVHLRTQAAIKVLQMRLAEEHAESFINEARTIAHLIHPNIVRVLDFGVQNAVPFLVMDYAPGGTIRRHMPSGRPLPPEGLFPFITQVASALQYAHNRKLMHRDIKPENMLIGVNGEVLLSDFGLALVTQSTSSRGAGGGDFSGTATYMAPEQARGKPRPASDQYALGIVVFEWLTGKRPFEGTFIEVATQQVLAPVPSLREKNPAIPLALEEVVMRAMAKEYQQRFPSVQEFAAALAQACEREGLITAQMAQAAQAVTASSAMPGASALGNVSQQLTYLQSVMSQGPQPSPNTPHPNIASEGPFLATSSSDQNYATEMISNLQVSPLSFMQKSSQTLQQPSKGAAGPASSSQKLQQSPKSTSSSPPASQQLGWQPLTAQDAASAEQTFMMVSALNNPVLVAKALKRATHINKALLVVSVFLICMLVVGGGAGLYFMHRNGRSVQLPPPINRGANKGTAVGQSGQDGTAGGGKQPVPPTSTPQNIRPTAAAQSPNPYVPSMGTLVVNDPMTSNQLRWDDGDSCKIDTKGYYIGVSGPQSTICYAHATDYDNFTYEVQMSFLKVDDANPDAVSVGLVFRGDNDTGASYRIEVTQNGRFIPLICKAADACTPFDDGQARPITDSGLKQASIAFNRGVEQSNKLAVVAVDNLLVFYINGQEVFSTKQAGFSRHGMIGLYLRDNNNDSSAVALFNNVRVWQA